MHSYRKRLSRATFAPSLLVAAGLALGWLLAAGGCVAIADVDDIDFGPPGSAGAGGPTGGGGQGAGSSHSCTDGIQNGQEEGVDCGGPDCDPCEELCTNGQDDNEDGLTDCADPLCSGYQCVPAAPAGWSGPIALYVGSNDELPPACDGAWSETTSAFRGFSAPTASCTSCSCSVSDGTDCVPELYLWVGEACLDAPDGMGFFANGPDTCAPLQQGPYASARGHGIYADDVVCAASGGEPNGGAASFDEQAVVCSDTTVGGGCNEAGSVCARRPPAPFLSSACIMQSGEVECPVDGYTERQFLYDGFTDTRSCSQCVCNPSHGPTYCGGKLFVYTDESCTQGEQDLDAQYECLDMAGMASAQYTLDGSFSGAGCAAQFGSGSPIGAAMATGPITVCCVP